MAESPFGYESSAINTRRVLGLLGLLALFLLIALSAIYFVLFHVEMPQRAQVVDTPGIIPPRPHLQADPQVDITAEREQKKQMLSRYAWLDSSHSFARIPINRAMELYASDQSKAGVPAHPTSSAGAGT